MLNNYNQFKNLHKKNLVLPERRKLKSYSNIKSNNIETKKPNNELKKYNIPDITDDKPALESILDKALK